VFVGEVEKGEEPSSRATAQGMPGQYWAMKGGRSVGTQAACLKLWTVVTQKVGVIKNCEKQGNAV